MSKAWPNARQVVGSQSSAWSNVLQKVPAIIHQVPASFDKIKENCEQISKWWLGTRLEKKTIEGCIINDTLDFDCVKDVFNKIAESLAMKPAGSGQYGATFMACYMGSCEYVLKIQMADNSFKREVFALYELNGWEYSPTIYDAWTCGGVGFMVIEKMESLKNCTVRLSKAAIARQVDEMVNQLHAKGWIHIDIKAGNIMCKNGHLALIDFGMAVKMPEGPLKYVLANHPVVMKKPMPREMLLEWDEETKQDAIDSIAAIAAKPRAQLKKAINAVRATSRFQQE
jgi:tRNA A-37 threonylcarbamoyl transferase component Bud32